jgi:hypothetical protein
VTVNATLLARFVVADTDTPANTDRRDLERMIADAELGIDAVALINGDTALAVPAGASALVLQFLTGAVSVTLKGVGGDTGVRLSTLAIPGPVMLPIVGGTSVVVLTSTGVGTARAYWF